MRLRPRPKPNAALVAALAEAFAEITALTGPTPCPVCGAGQTPIDLYDYATETAQRIARSFPAITDPTPPR